MAFSRLDRPSRHTLKPLAAALLMAGSSLAYAQQAPAQKTEALPEVKVRAQGDSVKVDNATSPKFTAPLLDTPKSVTVIPQEVMEERGASSLLDVLRTTPGITLGSGEGGTPIGDRPFIRGYEASTDLQIDGVRDLGRFQHESFNLESVEVIKGPGSAYSGRGSTGGSINMVSKQPRADNFIAGGIGLGTDSYFRATADVNQRFGDLIAARINVMKHDADVAGRDTGKAKRWGVAPSITIGMGKPTRATLSYYALRADDVPDLGFPFDSLAGGTMQPVDVNRDNFYGVKGRDQRRNDTDQGTLSLEHDFSNGWHLRNLTRKGKSISQYIVTRPTLYNGGAQGTAHPEYGWVSRDIRSGNRKSTTFTNQTDLNGKFNIAGLENQFAVGLEFSKEELKTGAVPTIGAVGRTPLDHPVPDVGYSGGTIADFTDNFDTLTNRTKTKAVYLFNTTKLAPQWDANIGLRYDKYDVNDGTLSRKDNLFNYQLGLVFKPASNGSVYLSYGTSSNPSGETTGQSGGADGAAGGGLGGGRTNLEPEKNRSLELGTKWNLFNNALNVTGAIFQTKKTNQRATDPITGDVALVGSNRTKGFELGVAGNITPAWSVFGGYTHLDPKMLNGGGDGSTNGKRLKFIAKDSFSLWTTYKITSDISVGGGAYYMSHRWMNDANTLGVPSYWRFDAMASYRINNNLNLRLNVQNIGDKIIYEGSHVGLFANVAPGRSAFLTLNFNY